MKDNKNENIEKPEVVEEEIDTQVDTSIKQEEVTQEEDTKIKETPVEIETSSPKENLVKEFAEEDTKGSSQVQDIVSKKEKVKKKKEKRDLTEEEKKERDAKFKNIGIIISLFLASFISVFGIYNNFGYSIIHLVNTIEDTKEMVANYTIFVIFVGTMFYLTTIYWKKRSLGAKLGVFTILTISLIAELALLFFFIQNITYTIWGLVVLGLSFYLFSLLFRTIGLIGFYFAMAIFGGMMAWVVSQGYVSDGKFLFVITEGFMAVMLFIGATYPRLKSLYLGIGTRDNVDIDNYGSRDENDGEDSED